MSVPMDPYEAEMAERAGRLPPQSHDVGAAVRLIMVPLGGISTPDALREVAQTLEDEHLVLIGLWNVPEGEPDYLQVVVEDAEQYANSDHDRVEP